MSMHRKDPTEALAALRADAITITTEQCIKAWREAVPGAIGGDPNHIDIVGAMGSASTIALGLALAQPSLQPGSFVNHPITLRTDGLLLRFTSFVEIT